MSQMPAIDVWATVALKEAYSVLGPRFEQTSGHKVAMHWVPTVDLMDRLKAGETTDLVISTVGNIDELIRAGVIVAGSQVALVQSVVAAAVRAGARRFDIASADALKQALLAAQSLAYSTGPSGVFMVALIERFGLTDALRSKVKRTKGEPVGAFVARGEAELGFQQLSELLPVRGIDILGPLPREVEPTTVFTAGLHVRARSRAGALALARHIAGADAGPVLQRTGLIPI
jgi:molybdate transport system substrate-binding protein